MPEPTDPAPISAENIRRQLDRILAFPELQSSDRRREMLRYVVEESLAGREDELKATTIAMAVFGRGSDFDQQSDPVVRLEARKLRRDLDNYYAEIGRDDPIRISIPKGRYHPKFDVQEGTVGRGSEAAMVQPDSTGQRELGLRNRLSLVLGLVAIAGMALVAALFLWTMRPGGSAPKSDPVSKQSVALLVEEFVARTGDEVETLVAAGLSNEIAAALIRFPDLAVHLSNDQVAGVSDVSAPIDRTLKPEFRVAGGVWHESGVLFVRAELIRLDDFEVLWSERYMEGAANQSITDILDSISSEIASAIGQQYGYALRDARATRLKDRNDPSLRGFACVASAQIYRRTYHRDEYQAVRDCLEATVREDPDYGRAWAMLAYLRNDAARFGHEQDLSKEAAFALARQAATRALDLDAQDTDALQAMSHVEQYAGNIDRSIEFAQQAVEVNPNDPAALANLAIRYGIAGRLDEGVPIMRRAIDRSVTPPPFYFHLLAVDHLIKEEWLELQLAAEQASADGWSFGQALLAIAHTELSNEPAAREALTKMAELDPRLAGDPKVWLEGHSFAPVIVDAVFTGITKARAALGE
ncbi:hypothetical protein [Sedimentitalea arenosa]|uniref:Tetratricopeptide repeat protein n=1 Tax=Sedimentitalea arenosa TaxID=2798803 RepID=A0A8J7LX68_9RHOB|nr:hypothetical protein [Arenibacterium arenosum]MBJ6373125.1 hypothetical protein [Arenibacterium arenosum]